MTQSPGYVFQGLLSDEMIEHVIPKGLPGPVVAPVVGRCQSLLASEWNSLKSQRKDGHSQRF